MDNLNDRLGKLRVDNAEKERQFIKEAEASQSESAANLREVWAEIKHKTRPATREDYVEWLKGHMANGGEPTHVYDYPISRKIKEFGVAHVNLRMPKPLYGANSLSIIFEPGVEFLGGSLGHSQLYFMDGFRNVGGFVPVYNDIKF